MMKKTILITAIVIIVLALAFNFWPKNKDIVDIPKTLKIGEKTLNIEVEITDAERMQGLSGREELGENEGMLFVFEQQGYYDFWMKDMKFPIDIIWLDKNKRITHTENSLNPNTYPKVFTSPIPSLYVLETPAGFLVKNNIQNGDFVAF